ncbi:hypothetical protein BH11MYX3_BH11MYX3_45390 [soil metagenome]
MKKCASCTKDLPDAALHCVFCGAKQAPSPALQPANAKTVMGYGGPELDALRAQAAAANAPNVPVAAPYSPPRPNPSQPPPMSSSPSGYSAPPGVPASAANAKTMFVDPPAGGHGPSMGGPMQSAPPQAGQFNVTPPSAATLATHEANRLPMPVAPTPIAPVAPMASPPYLASQTATRAGRPIEPWKDALPLMMFIWGGLLIAAFVTPLRTDPMIFNWDAIIHAEGSAKLPPLILAAVGLLTIVMAAIPLAAGARGMMALLLGLAGVFVPLLIAGMPPWQMLVSTIGMIMMPMGLLARHEYRDSALPRIVITIGALAYLLPYLLPVNGSLPLVELFQLVIDAPGAAKIILILMLGQITLAVLALLCWLPAPASGGAKVIAWLLILYPLFLHAAVLFLVGDPSNITNSPYEGAMAWIVGGGGGEAAAVFGLSGVGAAYLALTGYGGATVLGKQLE